MPSPAMANIPAGTRQALGLTRSNSCENMGPASKSKVSCMDLFQAVPNWEFFENGDLRSDKNA